jgi:hypothetical protein
VLVCRYSFRSRDPPEKERARIVARETAEVNAHENVAAGAVALRLRHPVAFLRQLGLAYHPDRRRDSD